MFLYIMYRNVALHLRWYLHAHAHSQWQLQEHVHLNTVSECPFTDSNISARSVSPEDLKILAHTFPKEDISCATVCNACNSLSMEDKEIVCCGDSNYEWYTQKQ